jgi:hypothetical protein
VRVKRKHAPVPHLARIAAVRLLQVEHVGGLRTDGCGGTISKPKLNMCFGFFCFVPRIFNDKKGPL